MPTPKRLSSLAAPDMSGYKIGRARSGIRGFSIFEMVLSVAAMGVALVFVIQLMNDNEYRAAGRDNAEQMNTFEQVATNYFNANSSAIMAAIAAASASDTNVQSHCVINVPNAGAAIAPGTTPGSAGTNGTLAWSSSKYTCAFDASLLAAKGLWPGSGAMGTTGHDADMGGDWRYVAIFRRQRLPGPDATLGNADDTWSPDAEMLIVRADTDSTLPAIDTNAMRKDSQRALNLSSQRQTAGVSGGTVPVGDLVWCRATRTDVQVCGAGWTIDLSNFIDATNLTTLKNALPTS